MLGNCTYALQVCYLNQKALRQKIGYKQEIKRTYVIPLLASLVMGAIVLGVYYGLFTLTHRVFLPSYFICCCRRICLFYNDYVYLLGTSSLFV